jgi:hypothetical protein
MKWTEIVTAIVAVLALGLSIYSVIYQQRAFKPKIRVKITSGLLTHGNSTSNLMLFLSAANIGQRPVVLNSQYLLLPDRRKFVFLNSGSNTKFPHELKPGESCQIWTEMDNLIEQLKSNIIVGIKVKKLSYIVKLVGVYTDQTDRAYKSKPFNVYLK